MGFKSKLIKKYDLYEAINAYKWNYDGCEGSVQEAFYQDCLAYKYYTDSDTIYDQAIATISFESPIKKFNGIRKVRVGTNLFDKDFEKQLLMKKKGVPYTYQDNIKYTILEIEQLFVPQMSDEIASSKNIEGVKTARDYHDYLYLEQLKDKLYDDSFDFTIDYLNKCEFDINLEDIDILEEKEMNRCRKIGIGLGVVFDEMHGDDLLGAVGCHDIPEFRRMIRSYFTKALKVLLIYNALTHVEVDYNTVNEKYSDFLDLVVKNASSKCMTERRNAC